MTAVSIVASKKTMRPACDQRLRGGSTSSPTNGKSKRKSTSLPLETVEYLKNWMMSPEHIAHPYPTEQEKADIMKETGIELKQLTNWFVNNRKRYWKPRVEARLQEQAKAQAAAAVAAVSTFAEPATKSSTSKAHVVTPTRRHSLIHVVSTPNVLALVNESQRERVGTRGDVLAQAVSEMSSLASESGSVGMTMDQDEESMSAGQATTDEHPLVCKEPVDVKVVTPSLAPKPTFRDTVMGPTDGKDDVVQTYVGCEILHSLSSSSNMDTIEVNSVNDEPLSLCLQQNNASPSKRKAVEVTQEDIAPRLKYRRQSIETWKKACEEANHGYCNTLPTLEEAARLFGYAA